MRLLLSLTVTLWSAPALAVPVLTATPDPAYGGYGVSLHLDGGNPGERWAIAVAVNSVPNAFCPPFLAGTCLDLRNPQLLALVTLDATGRATRQVVAPVDLEGTFTLQAARLQAAPAVSNTAPLTVLSGALDSDGDRLTDAEEALVWGTDPFAPDTDGDELYDAYEVYFGADPLSPDTDGDTIPDGWDTRPLDSDPLDPFTPCDALAADPNVDIKDPEYDQDGRRFVFQEDDGSAVWIGHIDPVTGDVVPPDGRGELVATGVTPIPTARNGPEWVDTLDGMQVVLSRPVGGTYVLARAYESGGSWVVEDLPGSPIGVGPFGSIDPLDPNPRVLAKELGPAGPAEPIGLQWRELFSTTGGSLRLDVADSRWVPGGRYVTGVRTDQDGVQQVFLQDVYRDQLYRVSTGPERARNPICWVAPDFGGETMCLARHVAPDGGRSWVRVHRYVPVLGWTTWDILPPAGWPYVASPEAFVHDGASYVSFVATRTSDNNSPGHVYIAPIDPGAPPARRLTDDAVVTRRDPEAFLTGAEPWVFYVEAIGPRRILHRACTGL